MTELDDDRQAHEPMQDEDAGDPAAAFDALRRTIETQGAQIGAEMTVMRRGLEAAFDQLEKIEPAQDYKPQLAQLVQQLAVVAEHLQGVEQSPILRNGPEHYAARLERSGEGLVRTAVQQLERQASDLERAGRNLSAHVASARERKRQNWWLSVASAIIASSSSSVVWICPRTSQAPSAAAPSCPSMAMPGCAAPCGSLPRWPFVSGRTASATSSSVTLLAIGTTRICGARRSPLLPPRWPVSSTLSSKAVPTTDPSLRGRCQVGEPLSVLP